MTIINLPFYLGAQSGASTRRRFGWVNIPVEVEESDPVEVKHASTRLYGYPTEPHKVDIFSQYLFQGRPFRAAGSTVTNSSGKLFNRGGILSEVPLVDMTEQELQSCTGGFSRSYYKINGGVFYRTMYSGRQRLSSLSGVPDGVVEAACSWAREKFLLSGGRLLVKNTLTSLVLPISGSRYSAALSNGILGGIHFAYPDEEFQRLKLTSDIEVENYRLIKEDVLQRFEEEVRSSEFVWAANSAFNPQALEEVASSFIFHARSVISIAVDVIEMHQDDLKSHPKRWRFCSEVLRLAEALKCDQSEEAVINTIAAAIPAMPKFRYSDRQREMIDLVLERYNDRPVAGLASEHPSSIKTNLMRHKGF